MSKGLKDVVEVIRSKNAGPFQLTLDIIFKDFTDYEEFKEKEVINQQLISDLYQISTEKIQSIIYFDPAKAVKITLDRNISAGAVGERDVYGAQQHAPLLKIEY